MFRSILAAAFLVIGFAVTVKDLAAHPLGNFSISQYSALRAGQSDIEIQYIVDLAEIPTFQEIQENGFVPAGGDPTAASYLKAKVMVLRDGLSLEMNGKKVELHAAASEISFPEGMGGLPTMKIGVLFKGSFKFSTTGRQELVYRDENFAGRAGWKEIIAGAKDGNELLDSTVPAADRSAQLSNYPTDLLDSPPQILQARLSFAAPLAASGGAEPEAVRDRSRVTAVENSKSIATAVRESPDEAPPQAHPPGTDAEPAPEPLQPSKATAPTNSFTRLINAKELSASIMVLAFVTAVALGAFHALEPGHGKTLVAAYLIGSHGTAKHALLLGLIVTVAHTAAVYLLGGVVLYASRHVVPEKIYPWLALLSGMMIIGLGVTLLLRRLRAPEVQHYHHHPHGPHSHDHVHDPQHHPHEHHHSHGHAQWSEPERALSRRELFALGISGGIVPCPAALVVLLSAVSLQRIGFGLFLIVAFSLGLAAVLIVIGLLTVYAGHSMSRFQGEGRLITRWLPLASSAFILLCGVGLIWQALASADLVLL